jgi:hypothetical protein
MRDAKGRGDGTVLTGPHIRRTTFIMALDWENFNRNFNQFAAFGTKQ